MKFTIGLMFAAITLTAHAAEMAKTYKITDIDCQGLSLIAEAAATNRDHGVPETVSTAYLRKSDHMKDPVYRAMIPTMNKAVFTAYSENKNPDDTRTSQYNTCRSTIGQTVRLPN